MTFLPGGVQRGLVIINTAEMIIVIEISFVEIADSIFTFHCMNFLSLRAYKYKLDSLSYYLATNFTWSC